MNVSGMMVGSVMRTEFLRLRTSTPMRDAVARLARRNVSAAPVVDEEDRLVGILTEKDCFRPMLSASYYRQWDGSVETYMSRDVQTLPEDLDLVSAAEAFLARSHRVYPVMRDVQIAGLLHRSDLFAALVKLSEPTVERSPN